MEVDGVCNMQALINETLYDIDKGWTYTKNANETLDSAVIKISHQTSKIDIQPFDNVVINDNLYLCVDSYTETQVSLDPIIYNYEIYLFSETKKLENVILPNLSITPYRTATPWTIKEVIIYKIIALYCPRRRTGDIQYSLPTTWPSKFDNPCPEKQWTTPTLRDVLNDLFMLCDCIPYMENNEIKILDLTLKNKSITNYNFITRTRSSQDYASDLKMNLQNVMQEEYSVKTYEHLTFTSDTFIVNDSNLQLETQFPILKINHLWMNIPISEPLYGSESSSNAYRPVYARVDLCNLKLPNDGNNTYSIVKEKQLYDILNVAKYVNAETFDMTSAEPYANCKNTCLYYVRGSNKISGFSQINKITLLQTKAIMKVITTLAFASYAWSKDNTIDLDTFPNLGDVFGDLENQWFSPTFEIEYETSEEIVFSASKKELLRNERTIMDNQTNAWVNAQKQGDLEYQKINRIGNEIVMINQRVDLNTTPIEIFDYLDNEIVYCVEYQVFNDYIDVNAYATKDYILCNYFTGVDSKIRTWINAKEEAFIRHDLYKYYVEIDEENSYNDEAMTKPYPYYSNITIDKVISAFNTSVFAPLNYCVFASQNGIVDSPDSNPDFISSRIISNVIRRIIGKSIVITWGFNDNYVALKQINNGTHNGSNTTNNDGIIAQSDFTSEGHAMPYGNDYYSYLSSFPFIRTSLFGNNELGGIPLKAVKYCDDEGSFQFATVSFYSEINGITQLGDEVTISNYYDDIRKQTFTYSDILGSSEFYLDALIFKDNKEIITGSLQIEYFDTQHVKILDDFLRLNHLIADEFTQGLLLYTASNLSVIPVLVPNGQVNISNVNNYSAQITISGTLDRWVWIYSGNKPLMRIDADEVRQFYINLKKKRGI